MTSQTDDQGQRLEEMYDHCMKLPAAEREAFIAARTAENAALGRQLRLMVQLEDVSAVSPFQTVDPDRTARADDLTSGAVFGKCQIVNLIDTGAMGAVYFARDLQNHKRPVALKVMRPTLLAEKDRERFIRESAALSRLVHPNIARLYFRDVEKWNDAERPFLVMEFVAGETLDKFLDHGHLSTRQVLELLGKIARAVHHGHRNGVYHRDLKPSNILVSPDGEPKIIDYGVSFTVSSESEAGSASHDNAGTVPYMAPEVASGAAYVPDARTDAYSLGIIAFEAFARRRPGVVHASGEVELLDPPMPSRQMRQKISVCERERLCAAHRHFAADLDCVIARALRLKIEDRYADVGEFAEDLRRLIDFEPIKELRKSTVYTFALFVRRNRLAVAAAIAIFATLLAAAINFRSGEKRESALVIEKTNLLAEKTIALKAEAVARREAEEDRDQIREQNAKDHMRAAELAEQRGNWSAAAEEYLAAEQGGYPDHLALAVGELRAFDRTNRPQDARTLIARVEKSMPDIAASPQFQVVEGFFFWTTDSVKSVERVKHALEHAENLPPKDRCFAQGLLTDNVTDIAARMKETLGYDPFNHDALTVLALCDLCMGRTQQCEQDAGVMQRLFPGDATGSFLAALGTAFQGRREAAIAYAESNPALPPEMKSTLIEMIDFVTQFHSMDDLWAASSPTLLAKMSELYGSIGSWPGAGDIRFPLAFSRVLKGFGPAFMFQAMMNPQAILQVGAQMPNGNGAFIAGWLAFKRGDVPAAEHHLQDAMTLPCLLDCRRTAQMILTLVHFTDNRAHHVPDNQSATVIKPDLDRLIALGGIYPEKIPQESLVADIALACRLYPQMRTLALGWLSRIPEDPAAMYYLAQADAHLDDRPTALSLYQRAIAKGLDGRLKIEALKQVKQLTPPPATQLATTQPTTAPF